MQNLTFNFNQTSTVHSFADNKGELWFRANDICEILGYENPRRTVSLHCKDKGCQKVATTTKGGKQELTYINEPNLYRLIIKSRKPEAEAFEEWVMEEVLPTIRKTGSYAVSGSLPDPYRSRPVAGGLSAEQISVVKAFHRQLVQCAPKEQQARLAVTLWSGIKRKFGTAYKNIAPEYYPEILSLMGRIAVHKGAAPFYIEGAPFANTQSISFDGSKDAKYLIEIKDGKIISIHELTVSRSCVPTPC